MRVLGIRIITGSAPMPITPVKLIDEQNTFVFHVPINLVAIFGDELSVRVKRATDLHATVVKEFLQFLLLLEQPCKSYLRLGIFAILVSHPTRAHSCST
jgi:hypothetical protein